MAKVRSRLKPRPKYRVTFIRQWREFRNLSQDRLIDRLGEDASGRSFLTKTSLSRIEQGKQPYSQRVLERLAIALGCEPGDLLMRNPLDESAPWSVLEVLQRLSPDRQADIARMIKALPEGSKTGTEG